MPIQLDGRLVGVAKLVTDRRTGETTFHSATRTLSVVVSEASQAALAEVLAREVLMLRHSVAGLRRTCAKAGPARNRPDPWRRTKAVTSGRHTNNHLVERALIILRQRHGDPGFCLKHVARKLECNPKYLTCCFTRAVGVHMHNYLSGLRVSRACRLLIDTTRPIKEVAYASGFCKPVQLNRAFRRYIGVTPGEYRRLFSAH